MNERQRVVYEMLRANYPDSPVVSETLAVSMERQITDLVRGYEVAHAHDVALAPRYAVWSGAVGKHVEVHAGGVSLRSGIITHFQGYPAGVLWAVFEDGTGILLQEDMGWREIGHEWGQA